MIALKTTGIADSGIAVAGFQVPQEGLFVY
jgi:hypothetical protein